MYFALFITSYITLYNLPSDTHVKTVHFQMEKAIFAYYCLSDISQEAAFMLPKPENERISHTNRDSRPKASGLGPVKRPVIESSGLDGPIFLRV